MSESFPDGKANAARARALVKLFQLAGYGVTVLCDKQVPLTDYTPDYPVLTPKKTYSTKAGRFLFRSHEYKKTVCEVLKTKAISCVVAESMPDRVGPLLSLARKKKIPFVLESCEQFNPATFRHGKHDIRYRRFMYAWKHLFVKADGVIAISRYLQRFYDEKGIPTVRVPAILETARMKVSEKQEETESIRLLYSGDMTGGKETMNEVFEALSRIRDEKKKFRVGLYGPTEEQLKVSLTEKGKAARESLGDAVCAHGRVSQSVMYERIHQSDYGIFIRPKRLSSEAGFPTKLGEYLAAGLPVITNDTGDISLVVKDGENGFLTEPTTADKLEEIFRKIASMDKKDRAAMRVCARASAEQTLDPVVYADDIRVFFEKFV